MKIVVLGAAGQLGSAIREDFATHATIAPLTRDDVDLRDFTALERRIVEEAPDVLVNCAAFNDVDGAEERAMDAVGVNALAVRAMARACLTSGALFVHYGTDFVFDGCGDRPYVETDDPAPQSVYAASKLLGEWFAADAARHYVLRVESLFGGAHRRSSVDRIADTLRNGEPARVFVDRVVTPSYVRDVSRATWELIERSAPSGLYHCVNSGVTTWLELGQEIARILGGGNLLPVKVADVKLRAKRPQYAALSNEKLRRIGIEMPSWKDALKRYLSKPNR